MTGKIHLLLLAAGLGAVLAGCSTSPNRAALGTVALRLTDAPGSYDAVNLVVTEVSIHRSGSESSGWETLKGDTTTYDLLTLRNGVFATLAQTEVPAGHYTQIRLKLGEGSNVVVGGVTHPLVIPSGMQSGYKLVGEYDVPANGTLELTLDFDAAHSIVATGNGRYMLKPTVRVIPIDIAGAIVGHVTPTIATSVFAIVGPDTLQSTETGAEGAFTLGSLAAGSYDVAFHPAAGYRDTTLTGVAVTASHTTDVGEVQLQAQP